jgi:phenylalanyl-tRNA synthetase alpha chain
VSEIDKTGENLILRTHNSSQQVRDMLKMWAPMKLVCPGRDYRFDDMDAHHDVMFHQLEWIYIDKNVSIANFKQCMFTLLSAVIWREVELRFRPCFFPFVEPGFEIDARYDIVDAKTWKTEKSNWMEILWAWMMHPNFLEEWGIDSKVYTWFAFGIGISRLAAVRYGIKDIRYFTNWDLRFVKSF